MTRPIRLLLVGVLVLGILLAGVGITLDVLGQNRTVAAWRELPRCDGAPAADCLALVKGKYEFTGTHRSRRMVSGKRRLSQLHDFTFTGAYDTRGTLSVRKSSAQAFRAGEVDTAIFVDDAFHGYADSTGALHFTRVPSQSEWGGLMVVPGVALLFLGVLGLAFGPRLRRRGTIGA